MSPWDTCHFFWDSFFEKLPGSQPHCVFLLEYTPLHRHELGFAWSHWSVIEIVEKTNVTTRHMSFLLRFFLWKTAWITATLCFPARIYTPALAWAGLCLIPLVCQWISWENKCHHETHVNFFWDYVLESLPGSQPRCVFLLEYTPLHWHELGFAWSLWSVSVLVEKTNVTMRHVSFLLRFFLRKTAWITATLCFPARIYTPALAWAGLCLIPLVG